MTLHTKLKTRFEEKCKDIGAVYYWTVKDASNLNLLIKKIEFSYLQKTGIQATEKIIQDSFNLIIEEMPKYYTFTIPIINSHFNEIIQHIKTKHGVSQEDNLQRTFAMFPSGNPYARKSH